MDKLWIWLVVYIPTHLKNMKVNWDDYSQYIWKNKRCSKQPTNYGSHCPVEMNSGIMNDIVMEAIAQ